MIESIQQISLLNGIFPKSRINTVVVRLGFMIIYRCYEDSTLFDCPPIKCVVTSAFCAPCKAHDGFVLSYFNHFVTEMQIGLSRISS